MLKLKHFFFFLLVTIATISTNKIHEKLREVGKRFVDFGLMDDRIISLENEREDFMSRSEEEINEAKVKTIRELTRLLVQQSSADNDMHKSFEELLVSMLHPDIQVGICGTPIKFNHYQFVHYLQQERLNWKRTDEGSDMKYLIYPSEKDVIDARIAFSQHSKYGYTSESVYNIQMRIDIQFFSILHTYKITKVTLLGGCTEHGTPDLSYTSLGRVDQETLANDTQASQFLALFKPAALADLDQAGPRAIPTLWLDGFAENADIQVCAEDVREMKAYTQEQLRSWYKHLAMVWHPQLGEDGNVTDEYLKIHMLEHTPGRMRARVSMLLQVDSRFYETHVVEWNFKITAEFNTNGDRKWRMSRLDVPCLVGLPLTVPHLNFLGTQTFAIERFVEMVPNNIQWYSAFESLRDLPAPGQPLNISTCNGVPNGHEELLSMFWKQNKKFDATLIGYEPWYPSFETDNFEKEAMFSMTIFLRENQGGRVVLIDQPIGVDWKFHLKWHEVDQFFYVQTLDVGCAEARNTTKYYSSTRG